MSKNENFRFLEEVTGVIHSDNIHSGEFVLGEVTREKLNNLRWTDSEIQYIEDLVSKLKTIPGCHKIWLYGSMARGDQDSNPDKLSDIDLAIEIEEGLYPENMFRRDIRSDGFREIQLNFFPIGFDEQTRDAVKEDDAVHLFDDENDSERVIYKSDYITRRSSQDATKRLRDQIILWHKD